MKYLQFIFLLFVLIFMALSGGCQTPDSTQTTSTFSGTVGITNNGFSIIPTFSLNHPAAIMNFSWRKKRVSFDPDIRLVPDASKGGLIFWVRYRLIEQKKFSLRVGAHPAFTLIRSSVTDNGNTKDITEMLRFLAFEVVPSYQITPHVGVSAMYLQGNALQNHGPQLTRVLFLNTSFTNLKLSQNLRLDLFPTIFFLHTDGYRGDYFTLTGSLSHKKWPFSLQSTINQTFNSNVPGNQNFMWNVALNYHFKRKVTGN
ncbi:hypothetical protein GVN20_22680 [Runella sp. CRIBMP]|uniref:hypothetical protein n=1 Tax=Runella sp. CRIBMP TaxID=2683261 RepID=UPI0014120E9A|nr:hypothetical protein [Runella sp. CRIBMP]NBB22179.1 hypothetical protein [Runella sp. CRIBMP]